MASSPNFLNYDPDVAANSHLDEAPVSGSGPPPISEALPNSNPDEILLVDELDAVVPPLRAPEIARFLSLDSTCSPDLSSSASQCVTSMFR